MEKEMQQLPVEQQEEKGASLVEYALLVALIAVVCILAITFVGQQASARFSDIGNQLALSPT